MMSKKKKKALFGERQSSASINVYFSGSTHVHEQLTSLFLLFSGVKWPQGSLHNIHEWGPFPRRERNEVQCEEIQGHKKEEEKKN